MRFSKMIKKWGQLYFSGKWGQLYFSEKPTTSRPNFPYWKLEQKWGQLYFSEQLSQENGVKENGVNSIFLNNLQPTTNN
jgi:hypothetical protein